VKVDPTACSTSRSSAFTNTSASFSTSCTPSRSIRHKAQPSRAFVPRVKIFPARRGELSSGQADHQARERRRQYRERGRGHSWPAESGVPAQLQCQPREHDIPAADLSEQISTAAWRPRHRNINRSQRRLTIARWTRECGNQGARGRRQYFHLRPDGGRGGREPRAGIDAAKPSRQAAPARGLAGRGDGSVLAGRPQPLRPTVDTLTITITSSSRGFHSYWDAQEAVDAAGAIRSLRAPSPQHARVAWFSSDRTIREYAEDIWKVPV